MNDLAPERRGIDKLVCEGLILLLALDRISSFLRIILGIEEWFERAVNALSKDVYPKRRCRIDDDDKNDAD